MYAKSIRRRRAFLSMKYVRTYKHSFRIEGLIFYICCHECQIGMERDQLLEIEEKDREDYLHWIKELKAGKTDAEYPNIKKYGDLKEPIGEISFNNIWSAVPSFNTLFVPIYPISEPNFFEKMHGFSINDIPRLAQYSRDTKRVRFFLSSSPTSYANLDFFNPIFEINPHSIYILPPNLFFDNEKELMEKEAEFDVLASINFYEFNRDYLKYIGSSEADYKRRMRDYCYDYILLHAFGYKDVIEYLEDKILYEPYVAACLLNILHRFIINPKVVPYNRIPVYDVGEYRVSKDELANFGIKLEEMSFPYEIGKYVMEKIGLYPESFTACEHICAIYEQEDYYDLVNALHNGVKRNDLDLLQNSSEEISEILDNIWEEASKISSRSKYVKYGFTIGFAALGAVAGGILGAAAGGVLGSFGFDAGMDVIKSESESVYEKIAKSITDSHLCTIFDFSKKYQLPSK